MSRFAVGQRVVRDMGINGGHWDGIIVKIPGDRIFDADDDSVCGHCADLAEGKQTNNLHVDMNAVVKSDRQRRSDFEAEHGSLDVPQYPVGYFDRR